MHHYNWGIIVALDLFLAGLSAGLFLFAVFAERYGGELYKKAANVSAKIAPWPACLGVLLLILDLGKPLRFWEMILQHGEGLLMFKISSMMSLGIWFLSIFVALSVVYAGITILDLPLKKIRSLAGTVNIPFAVLVTVYTGVLIAATANPLWNNWLLPALFSTSAMATAVAGIIFILTMKDRNSESTDASVIKLEKINSKILALQLIITVLYFIISLFIAPKQLVAGSVLGVILWILILGAGLLIPLKYTFKGESNKPKISFGISALVILGGFFMRYIILIGGQVF
ncbi:NrfD/PsrC family molybdoenzyme membrane anchor subunit [Spirochaetota bacterium]